MITVTNENGIKCFRSDNHGVSQNERHEQFIKEDHHG